MSIWLVIPLVLFASSYGYMLGRSITRIREIDLLIEGQQIGYLKALEQYGPTAAISMSAHPSQ